GSAGALAAEQSHFEHFITRDGAALKDGDRLFRFAGIHAPELHRIEDDARGTCKADPRGWGQYFKWPTAEEQENWIKALVQTGAKAQRVYVLSVQQENDAACGRET
ncbi:TPA: beta-1,4 mannanase, partial [Klebsiella aerogenes]|nr:beta-1,4 mannanase [Klebsiella aerogenes]HDT2319732.1 beta-1,4 mannanase [Klebsiella aerogenes]